MEFEGFSSIVAFNELMSRVMLFHLFSPNNAKQMCRNQNKESEFKLDSPKGKRLLASFPPLAPLEWKRYRRKYYCSLKSNNDGHTTKEKRTFFNPRSFFIVIYDFGKFCCHDRPPSPNESHFLFMAIHIECNPFFSS